MAKRREKGSGSLVRKAGCKIWYAQYYKNGRQITQSTKTAIKQEALGELRKLMGEAERGITPESELKKIRYGHLRKALIDSYVMAGNKSLQVLADGSETIWGLKQLDEFFGYKHDDPGAPLTQITTDAAREFARKRQTEGVSSATINRSLACLRRMLRLAYEENKIQFIPKIRLLKEPPARKGFIEREKFDLLLTRFSDHVKPLILFLYYCGVRVGEALQIEWVQVDLKAGLIRLEDEQTKSGDPRIVPLPDMLIRMLEKVEPKDGRVFDCTNLRKEWQKACAAAGLGVLEEVEGSYDKRYHGLTPHDLRRSAVRNLRKAGVSEGVAMKISGHKTRSVFERYNIVDESDVVDAMRLVQAMPQPKAKRKTVLINERLTKKALPARTERLQLADSK